MRARYAIAGVFAAVLCVVGQSRAQEAAPPTIEAFYSTAVESMRSLPQPQYLTYTVEGAGYGLAIRLKVIDHLVWLEMMTSSPAGPTPPIAWSVRHRTNDYASEIIDIDGRRLVSTRAFFDPTWYGAFRALRDGMLFYQKTEQPVSAYATPTPGPSPDLRTIAVVQVVGSNIYNIVDKGPSVCTNGDPGHAVHLISREPDPRHQLADVVVDLRNMHFCTMRFNVTESGFRGSVEQHYSDVGGYWLQTDGTIESGVRTFGIMMSHGLWRYRLDQMTFPPSIEPQAFLRPPDQ
ncbi:MAG: hypothetical protein WB615_11995 [Candidatus Tumulicola sp.]